MFDIFIKSIKNKKFQLTLILLTLLFFVWSVAPVRASDDQSRGSIGWSAQLVKFNNSAKDKSQGLVLSLENNFMKVKTALRIVGWQISREVVDVLALTRGQLARVIDSSRYNPAAQVPGRVAGDSEMAAVSMEPASTTELILAMADKLKMAAVQTTKTKTTIKPAVKKKTTTVVKPAVKSGQIVNNYYNYYSNNYYSSNTRKDNIVSATNFLKNNNFLTGREGTRIDGDSIFGGTLSFKKGTIIDFSGAHIFNGPFNQSTFISTGRSAGSSGGTTGGVTDHGALSGLGDNDHPQYPLKAGDEIISGGWTFFNTTTIATTVIPYLYVDKINFNGSERSTWPIGGGSLDSTSDLPEGTNLYFTDDRARQAISVSGASLAYASSTGVLSVATDYNIPLTVSTTAWNNSSVVVSASSSGWDLAYSWGNHASAGYLTSASAASTYLTQASAASTYLTTASAASTYQPIGSYLTFYTETDPLAIHLGTTSVSSITSLSNLATVGSSSATTTMPGNLQIGGGVNAVGSATFGTIIGTILNVDSITLGGVNRSTWPSGSSGGGGSFWVTSSDSSVGYPDLSGEYAIVIGAATTSAESTKFEVVGNTRIKNGGLTLSNGNVSIGGSATTTGSFTIGSSLGLNGEYFTDLTGVGLINNEGALAVSTSSLGLPTFASLNDYLTISDASSTYLTQASAASTYQPIGSYLTSYTETDPLFMAASASLPYLTVETDPIWLAASSSYLTVSDASSTYLTQASAASTYQPTGSYLTSYTETDPLFMAASASLPYLTSFTESDPLFMAASTSLAYVETETDPVFIAWDKSAGISITKSQVSDFGSPLYSYTETDPLFMAASASLPYLTVETDPIWLAASSSYLTVSDASSTYLTSASAASTYLTQASAALTYLALSGGTVAGDLTVNGTSTLNATMMDFTNSNLDFGNYNFAGAYNWPYLKASSSNLVGGSDHTLVIDDSILLVSSDNTNFPALNFGEPGVSLAIIKYNTTTRSIGFSGATGGYSFDDDITVTGTSTASCFTTNGTDCLISFTGETDPIWLAASSSYLTVSDASSTYLTSASAASTYLTQASAASTYQPTGSYLTSYTETDPLFMAASASLPYLSVESDPIWLAASSSYLTVSDASSTYLTQANAASTYQPTGSYLTSYTETDPLFMAASASLPYLTSFTESDPLFMAASTSLAYVETETDPVFIAWDKSAGISITKSQVSDFGSPLYSYTETDPLFMAASASLPYLSVESDPVWLAASSSYLTVSDASSTYLTQASAALTYLALSGGTVAGDLTVNGISTLATTTMAFGSQFGSGLDYLKVEEATISTGTLAGTKASVLRGYGDVYVGGYHVGQLENGVNVSKVLTIIDADNNTNPTLNFYSSSGFSGVNIEYVTTTDALNFLSAGGGYSFDNLISGMALAVSGTSTLATTSITYLTLPNITNSFLAVDENGNVIVTSTAGFLTSYTETDPLFMAASASLPYLAVESDPIWLAASSSYLTVSDASSTYLTSASAASTYLTQASATLTYLALSGGTITGDLTVSGTSTLATLRVLGVSDLYDDLAVKSAGYYMTAAPLVHAGTDYDLTVTTGGNHMANVLIDKASVNIGNDSTSLLIAGDSGSEDWGVALITGDFGAGADHMTLYFRNSDFTDAADLISWLAGIDLTVTIEYYHESIWVAHGAADYTWTNPDSKALVSGFTSPPTFSYVVSNALFVDASANKVEASTLDVSTAYKYNGANVIIASTTLGNYFFGGAGNLTMTGGTNLGIGAGALAANATGTWNTAIGSLAMGSNISGSYSFALGKMALAKNESGNNNIAIGDTALGENISGSSNLAIGDYALFKNTGSNNTAIGAGAGHENVSGNGSVFIGPSAGYYETAGDKLFIDNRQRSSEADGRIKALIYGIFADTAANQYLNFNSNVSIAGSATTTGTSTLATTSVSKLTVGDSNVYWKTSKLFLDGFGDFPFLSGQGVSTTDSNTKYPFGVIENGLYLANTLNDGVDGAVGLNFINYSTSTSSMTSAGTMEANFNLGAFTFNWDVLPADDDGTYNLGASGHLWNEIFATNGTINTSDARLKDNVNNLNYGLDQVLGLRPVTYTWKNRPQDGTKIGLLAQEVLPLIPEAVNIGDDANHTLGLRYDSFIPVLVKAIQQQQVEINNLSVSAQAASSSSNVLAVDDNSDKEFNNLGVAEAATFYGTIDVVGEAGFTSRVTFKDHIYFDRDAAGQAKIVAGATSTEVVFNKPYESVPIINATPLVNISGRNYWIENQTTTGFIIAIDPVPDRELEFNWQASAIDSDATTIDSDITDAGANDMSNIEFTDDAFLTTGDTANQTTPETTTATTTMAANYEPSIFSTSSTDDQTTNSQP
ncbi:MAG: tail fiber domain-containing protein [Patescibacteria group bacterium]